MAKQASNRIRALIGVALLVILAFAFTTVLDAVDALVALLERAQSVSSVVYWMTVTALVAFGSLGVAIMAWWFWPRRRPRKQTLREPDVRERLARKSDQGIDMSAALSELDELDARRHQATLYVAFFGEVSAGKSSLIGALAESAAPKTDVRAGTTTHTTSYAWTTASGDTVQLVDAPGFSESEAGDTTAHDEAVRAHLVVYVCHGDLTRSQWTALSTLVGFGKPVVVAVNKADRFAADELDNIRQSIAERFERGMRPQVVPVVAGGQEVVTVIDADGREREATRPRKSDVAALHAALQSAVTGDPAALTTLRDHAVFQLATHKAEAAERAHQDAAAEQIVARHTRAAVIGAMAAISPGSDLVIQGVIGARLVRQLCDLFGVRARDVDVDAVLKTAGTRARNSSALVLAVAGNGLKAFPGLGTLGGGLVHAVAYGLLFDAFGRALSRSLHDAGALEPQRVADELDARLADDLTTRARRIAALALRARNDTDPPA